MTTLAGDLCDRALRWAEQNAQIDLLGAALLTGAQNATVSITTTDASKWGAPAVAEIDSELFLVTSFNRSTGIATAQRGYLDSTPAAHSAGALCKVNPRFYRRDAFDAIVDCCRKLCPPLYRIKATSFTYSSSSVGYNLTDTAAIDIYQMWAQLDSATQRWKELFAYNYANQMPTASFAGGNAILLGEPGIDGLPLRVLYKAKFTAPTSEADDMETTVGLDASMLDIPVWYAVSVLVPPDEVFRGQVDAAVPTQRGEMVLSGQNMRTAEYFRSRYTESVREAAALLQQMYPPRPRIVRT